MIKINIDRNCKEYESFIYFIINIINIDIKNHKYYKVYCPRCYVRYNFMTYDLRHSVCNICNRKIIIEKCNKISNLYKNPTKGYSRIFYLLLKRISKLHPSVVWMYIESHIKDND